MITADRTSLRATYAVPREVPLPRDALAVRRILVCVDRSPFSSACLDYAVAASKSFRSPITILHVLQPSEGRPVDVLDWEIARHEASAYLEQLQRDVAAASGRRVEIRLEQGHPVERIEAVARELDAGLMVIGRLGERGESSAGPGSTLLPVLAVTRASVLVARASAAPAGVDVSPRRILVPLDGSIRTENVLPTAALLASEQHAELLLVLVVKEATPTLILSAPEDVAVAAELATRMEVGGTRYLNRLRRQLVHDGVHVRTRVVRGVDERQTILDQARKERSELIVLSAHGSSCNPALPFGNVSAYLLTHSNVPVFALQDVSVSDGGAREPSSRRAPPLCTHHGDV